MILFIVLTVKFSLSFEYLFGNGCYVCSYLVYRHMLTIIDDNLSYIYNYIPHTCKYATMLYNINTCTIVPSELWLNPY